MRLGSDPDEMAATAALHHRSADRLDDLCRDLVVAVRNAVWVGQTRERVLGEVIETVVVRAAAVAEQFRAVGRRLDAQAGAQRVVSSATLAPVPRSILSLNPFGDGRAVVAVGDLDRAAYIAVVVPGIGTTLDNLPSLVEDAARVRSAALAHRADGTEVAVVAWLGYDTPGGLDEPLEFPAALSQRSATVGAESLASFVTDLRRRSDAPITLIGHSYGSLVVVGAAGLLAGDEASTPGAQPTVDGVVVLGSPGVGADRADDLGLGAGTRFFAAATPTDVVSRTEWFGPDPAGSGFGSTVLHAGSWPGQDRLSWTEAHSAYFDEGSQVLDGVARAVVGDIPGW